MATGTYSRIRATSASKARISANCTCAFFNIGPELLAQVRDGIGVRDLYGEKRIRRVFDKLGAVDRGDDERGRGGRGARPLVHRAVEFLIQDRPVDFPKL